MAKQLKPYEFKKGNQAAKKLTTLELKLEAYRQYCAHVASGYPKQAWCFDHPEITLTWDTMESYMKDEPSVFPAVQMKKAESESYKHWFGVLSDSAKGINEKASTASLQMIMRNKFKWDQQTHVTHAFEPDARRLIQEWEK